MFMIWACVAMASPARRSPFVISLTDGRTVTVVKCGDEHKHWIETVDGHQLVLENENGYRLADEAERAAFFESSTRAKVHRKVGKFQPVFPTTGNMRSLVILVNYQDVKMKSATAQQDFQRMMTEPGYSELGGTGSARDYYVDNSLGVFVPQFDVVGPVELAHGYAYYGENKGNGDDMRAEQMIIDACRLVDDEVDFSQYDFNNDGYIDNVFVFYAGYGEATTMDKNTIWPHSWDITEATSVPIMLDGKRLNHYACTNELDSDGIMDGIGTFVHEFGHVLGLPDLYSTQGSNAFTPNIWTVMDEGEYNNNSRTPPYFTAFERYSLGWLSPIEVLGDGCQVAINDISTNEAYIIPTANNNEYFLLENRQQKGWDTYIPGHGMLVWHIDYDPYLWDMNRVNNTSTHQYVDIVEADNVQSTGTRSSDPFPGLSGVTSFTANTTPAFLDWNGGDPGIPLTNIREENGIILLDAAGGGAPLEPLRYAVPEAEDAKRVTDTSFLASWQPVEDAESYLVSVGKMVPGNDATDLVDFTGGLESLPANWSTNVNSTFSNSSYAGTSVPSLRMQKAGDRIECYREGIKGVQFWSRGSSVKEGTTLDIEWLNADAVVVSKETYTVSATASVVSYDVPADAAVCMVRLVYNPAQGSGSLALDDIAVLYAEPTFKAQYEELATADTQLFVSGLHPDTDYAYYVVAVKGKMRSRQSEMVRFHTLLEGQDAIQGVNAASDKSAYHNLAGQRVSVPSRGLYIRQGRKMIIK